MAQPVSHKTVDAALRAKLIADGYSVSMQRLNGETGVDILANRDEVVWHIEVIGYAKEGTKRSRDFFEAFFRAISRIKDGATQLALALPLEFERGMERRAAQYGIAWKRLARAFPELEIWFVDHGTGTVRRTTWGEWLKDS